MIFKLLQYYRYKKAYGIIKKSRLFNEKYYLFNYPDIRKADINPIKHYLLMGAEEGRWPNSEFDTNYYLKENKDVKESLLNPFVHYILMGKDENRKTLEISKVLQKGNVNVNISKKNQLKAILECPSKWETKSNLISKIGTLDNPCEELDEKIRGNLLANLPSSLPSISVVMPTWNRKNSISQAIDSILCQSLLPLEILICDDGSTDGTVKLVRDLYSKEISSGLIRVIENSHQGVSATRNSGLSVAKGELIAYLDSDNKWRKDFILLMTLLFSENDELMSAYGCLQGFRDGKADFLRADKFNRKRLLDGNFIDLNIFVHRHQLYRQYGGFDNEMKRLVDWDLIIKYTRNHEPAVLPYIGVDYYLNQKELNNITFSQPLNEYLKHVYRKFFLERIQRENETLRIAYVIWDFPALSQTFVMNELRWLVTSGFDVKVYFKIEPDKSADLDFNISSEKVKDSKALAESLIRDKRNLCHSHFAYPVVTELVYPACLEVGIYYSFMPHAVDIFHHKNRERNEVAKISNHPLCLKVFVYGDFHRDFLIDSGVSIQKIAYNMQAVDLDKFKRKSQNLEKSLISSSKICRAVVIARFIEKKGIEYLIEAQSLLGECNLVYDIYGYGPLLDVYKKRIEELGINNINFHGAVNNAAELAKIYTSADMLIVPAVVAENGDMDGFPTVIMEAMSANVPVITTNVSAIPDYITNEVEALVVPEKDSRALSNAIKKLMHMSPYQREAILDNAQVFLKRRTGTNKSMDMLIDTWMNRTIDIFMVTYNTPEYENSEETFEIIKRVLIYTTTPFTLTIVDNGSSKDFLLKLEKIINGYENISLILKKNNIFCGPASNIALEKGKSQYSIYICSKEGFISGHGWERPLIKTLDSDSNIAMAGHLSCIPKYIYGKEYENYPQFNDFRNQDFARENPNKVFRHIQGGIYILRRSVFLKVGGFNDKVYHNGMDVEYSYYLESCGYKLANIPEVAAVTLKTRPEVYSIIDENTVIAHPLSIKGVKELLDPVVKREKKLCNICGWLGNEFKENNNVDVDKKQCPKCNSSDTSRKLYRFLSSDYRIHRNGKLSILSNDLSFGKVLNNRMFNVAHCSNNEKKFLNSLSKNSYHCIIVDAQLMAVSKDKWIKVIDALVTGGILMISDIKLSNLKNYNSIDLSMIIETELSLAISDTKGLYNLSLFKHASYQVGYDWRPILNITKLD